jgi:8-oxo-dGTP diphosphatase
VNHPANLRHAARALVVTPGERVLLAEHHVDGVTVWAPPGGGVEPGETVRETIARELHEEVGLSVDGSRLPHVWHQEVVADWAPTGFDGVRNDYFVLRVPQEFSPRGRFDDAELLRENLHGFRWWSAAEILAVTDEFVVFSPRGLGPMLPSALRHHPTEPPLPIGL